MLTTRFINSCGIRFKHALYSCGVALLCTAGLAHASGENINIALGDLPPGKSVTVVFDATVDAAALAAGSVSQQGTISGANFTDVSTDDPDVGGAADATTTGIVNAEIVIDCGGTLVLNEGDGGIQTISASDADGTIDFFSLIVSPTPTVGSITFGTFTPEADPAPATTEIVVSSDVPAGTYSLDISVFNTDTPIGQISDCTLVIDIKGEPGFAASAVDSTDVNNEAEGPGSTVLFTTYAGRAPQANAVSSQNFTDSFLGNYATYAADDFTIPATDPAWQIRTVNLNGTYHNNSIALPGPADSVNVYILGNSLGQPDTINLSAGAIYAAENVGYTDAGYGDFTIPLPGNGVSLPPGTYWLVVQANMNLAQGGQWSWTESSATPDTGTAVGAESTWFQTNGTLVASGCVDTWGARITDCGVTNSADPTAVEPDLLFSLVGEVPTPGILVSPTTLITTEGGASASFDVVLTAPPASGATVTIDLGAPDASEGSLSSFSMNFTAANWDIPQTITVTGVDDAIADGNVSYTIATDPAVSTDPDYSGLDAVDISVTNKDDDLAGIQFSTYSGLGTTEAGGTDTFTVRANTAPTDDVVIPLTSSDASEVTISSNGTDFFSSVNITLPSGTTAPITVTVRGEDDDIADGSTAFSINVGDPTSAGDAVYDAQGASDAGPAITGTNSDDDFPGVNLVSASGAVTEAGGAAVLEFALLSEPTMDVLLPVFSTDTSEGIPDVSFLLFTPGNWDTPQAVTVTGQDDALLDGDVFFALQTGPLSSDDPVYNGVSGFSVPLTGVDDDGDPDSTTTVISSSANPANPGDPVTLTATVIPDAVADVPFGLVEFFDGAVSLGVFTTDGTGAAQVTTSSLAEGDHNITAVYAGGPLHTGSTSGVFVQTIAPLSIVVDSLADDNDGDLSLGDIELREAIAAIGTGGTITFDPGILRGAAVLQLAEVEGPLVIDKEVTITGPGADQLAILPSGDNSVLAVGIGGDATISGLTMAGGGGVGGPNDAVGGAITVEGTLSLDACIVGASSADSYGGAIYVTPVGALRLVSTVVSDSDASIQGGGIFNEGSTVILSSLIENNASFEGGGLYNTGTLELINSTVSNCRSIASGSGVKNDFAGTAEVVNATITNNTSGSDGTNTGGGGIDNASTGDVGLANTIVAGNFRGIVSPDNLVEPDVRGAFVTRAVNLIGDTAGSTGLESGNILLTDTFVADIAEVLLPLADNGGPTETHALAIGSPAINAGDDAFALDDMSNALTTDQRGAGFPRIESTAVDIGAFELTPETDAPTVTIEQNSAEPDPANTTPFAFDIEFSESVSDLDLSGITVGGTATGVVANVSRTGLRSFTLQVTSVTGDGTIVPTVNANAVQDAFGNANTASTSVDNEITYDATVPSITLLGSDPEFVECAGGYADAGATATDNIDGDLTLSINVGGDTVDTSAPNTYVVTYDVMDAAGNAASQVTRTVEVVDMTDPVINFPEGQDIFVDCGDTYTPQAVTAIDLCDGDLTSGITVFGDSVDTSTPGAYTVFYEVQDGSGNVGNESISVEVADVSPPVISLVGPAAITLACQEAYVEQGALVGDACGGANPLVIGGDTVDPSTPGDYVITYNAQDAAGNDAIEVTRTVTVSPGPGCGGIHTTDRNSNNVVELTELLRLIQLWQLKAYSCDGSTEDGYTPGPGDESCPPHDSDYNPQDWTISLSEILRVVQFFTVGGYNYCPADGTEDGFCPGLP